jgi:hypothetical protein
MALLAHPDLGARGREFKLRALLEDFVEQYRGVRSGNKLALAVWFGKSPGSESQNVLGLFQTEMDEIRRENPLSLLWKMDAPGPPRPPFVTLHWTSVNHFSKVLQSNPDALRSFFERPEVLCFDKELLDKAILRAYNVVTEPPGLLKGWYVPAEQRNKFVTLRSLLSAYGQSKPSIGLVKIDESTDFKNCRGLLHVEVGQRWVPLSPEGLKLHTFYNDLLDERPGYFLFQGGSLYHLLKFEDKAAPESSTRLLEQLRDARYPEVYLRAVQPAENSAA